MRVRISEDGFDDKLPPIATSVLTTASTPLMPAARGMFLGNRLDGR